MTSQSHEQRERGSRENSRTGLGSGDHTAARNRKLPPQAWPGTPHHQARSLRAGAIYATALLPLILFASCGAEEEAPPVARSRAVESAAVRVVDRPESFRVTGRVTSSREAVLSFKSAGVIASINVDEGDSFRKGRVLAALDTTEIAALAADAAELRAQAERDFGRVGRLFEERVATLKQFQDAETGLERARAAERRARFNLEHSILRAPFDGAVSVRMAHPGELRGTGDPVLRIIERGSAQRLEAGVPARFAGMLQRGDQVEAEVEARPGRSKGSVAEIGASVEPRTGNIMIKVELTGDEVVREGLAASLWLRGPSRPVIVLPAGALAQGDEDRGFIFLIEDGRALRREVRLLDAVGDSIHVRPDLPAGARVIVRGAGFLRDGDPVEEAAS